MTENWAKFGKTVVAAMLTTAIWNSSIATEGVAGSPNSWVEMIVFFLLFLLVRWGITS